MNLPKPSAPGNAKPAPDPLDEELLEDELDELLEDELDELLEDELDELLEDELDELLEDELDELPLSGVLLPPQPISPVAKAVIKAADDKRIGKVSLYL